MELVNNTPFAADRFVQFDRDGRDELIVAIKATLSCPQGDKFQLAAEQIPIIKADEHYGEPDKSSIRYECDYVPPKLTTDIVMHGHAYASDDRTRHCDLTLRVGASTKTCRVFGERHWEKTLGVWNKSSPEFFDRVPLCYEYAFGGRDESAENKSHHEAEWRNPVGCGIVSHKSRLDTLAMPQIEDPRALINDIADRPAPAGFGFIGRHWRPRRDYAGTYDQAWQDNRSPLLPTDFDDRYFNSAHPDLITATPLCGGESVEIENATPDKYWRFTLPRIALDIVAVKYNDDPIPLHARMDTVLIQPDERQIALTFRARLGVYKELTKLGLIRIKWNGIL